MHRLSQNSLCAPLAIAAILLASSTRAPAADDLASSRDHLYSNYAAQLAEQVSWCDANDLPQQAELARKWLPKREPATSYFFTFPDTSAPPGKIAQSSIAQRGWDRFSELRRQQADKLFDLAQSALQAKQPSLAYELVRETVRENPDHPQARKILGYEKYQNAWKSAEAVRRLRAGEVWDESFGWLPADQLAHYEHGMRSYRGNWIDAADDARLHSNIKNGWHVESDHYAVTTNQSLEEGIHLTQRLETLYEVWRQLFLPYVATQADAEKWFADTAADSPSANPPAAAPHKLHQVIYFRDKQQYIDALIRAQPQIAVSLGFYSDTANTAYFFHDDQWHDAVLNHEGTHQLFYELKPGAVRAGKRNNFWIVEGIACYMESMTDHRLLPDESYGSYITIGGDNEGRVPAARKRLIDDNFYVPLRELVAYGIDTLQHDPRLPMLYSESTGLAFFLMHADNQRYRPALIDYLIAVYTGHAAPDTLEKLTGQRFEELDRQYREFMK